MAEQFCIYWHFISQQHTQHYIKSQINKHLYDHPHLYLPNHFLFLSSLFEISPSPSSSLFQILKNLHSLLTSKSTLMWPCFASNNVGQNCVIIAWCCWNAKCAPKLYWFTNKFVLRAFPHRLSLRPTSSHNPRLSWVGEWLDIFFDDT